MIDGIDDHDRDGWWYVWTLGALCGVSSFSCTLSCIASVESGTNNLRCKNTLLYSSKRWY